MELCSGPLYLQRDESLTCTATVETKHCSSQVLEFTLDTKKAHSWLGHTILYTAASCSVAEHRKIYLHSHTLWLCSYYSLTRSVKVQNRFTMSSVSSVMKTRLTVAPTNKEPGARETRFFYYQVGISFELSPIQEYSFFLKALCKCNKWKQNKKQRRRRYIYYLQHISNGAPYLAASQRLHCVLAPFQLCEHNSERFFSWRP